MEIFNIHIFEFVLIAGLALVVFGPERLPEVGRFIGKQVARFLAWQQQSPELKMINDVRGEFEREIAGLRDELVRTRNQLDISKNIGDVKGELKSALDLRGEIKAAADAAKGAVQPSIAPPQLTNPAAVTTATSAASADSAEAAAAAATEAAEASLKAAEIATEAAETAANAAQAAADAQRTIAADTMADAAVDAPSVVDAATPAEAAPPAAVAASNGAEVPAPPGAVPATLRPNKVAGTQPTDILSGPRPAPQLPPLRRSLHDAAPRDEPAPAALAGPADDEGARLVRRLEGLMADMQALVGELQERGLIRPDWQPPSATPATNHQESVTR